MSLGKFLAVCLLQDVSVRFSYRSAVLNTPEQRLLGRVERVKGNKTTTTALEILPVIPATDREHVYFVFIV